MYTNYNDLHNNNDFRKSLFYAWDGLNEKMNKSSSFASSNKDIQNKKMLLNSVMVKQLFRIQLSKRLGYTFYYFQGLDGMLKDGIQFYIDDFRIVLNSEKQYIKVAVYDKKDVQAITFNLSENGLKQLKKLDLNKAVYKVIWDLLQRYQSRIQGLK
jgi:hypothetical protein